MPRFLRFSPKKSLGWLAIALLTTGCEQAINYMPPLPRLPEWLNSPGLTIPVQTADTAETEDAVRDRINAVRLEHGLQPLQQNDRLAQVARDYSRQMAEQRFFSHTGADGSTLVQRVKEGGIVYWMVGENLYTSTNIPRPVSSAVEGWMNSEGHRANILQPSFRETGVGVWWNGNTCYITQLFLRR